MIQVHISNGVGLAGRRVKRYSLVVVVGGMTKWIPLKKSMALDLIAGGVSHGS